MNDSQHLPPLPLFTDRIIAREPPLRLLGLRLVIDPTMPENQLRIRSVGGETVTVINMVPVMSVAGQGAGEKP